MAPTSIHSGAEVAAFLDRFHKAADSLTTTSFHKLYTENARLRFANNPELVGRAAIIESFDNIFPLLSYMKHNTLHFDVVDNVIYMSATITYGVANDPENFRITIPAFGKFGLDPDARLDEACLADFGVYLDISPVFARMKEVEKMKAEA